MKMRSFESINYVGIDCFIGEVDGHMGKIQEVLLNGSAEGKYKTWSNIVSCAIISFL